MDSTSNKNFTAALDTSLKEHNLVQLNSYLSAKPDCSDVLNKTTIATLLKILKKEKKVSYYAIYAKNIFVFTLGCGRQIVAV